MKDDLADDATFRALLEDVARLDVDDVSWCEGDTLCDDRFTLGPRLGGGGMGVIFSATDHRRTTSVAVKTTRSCDPRLEQALTEEFRLLTTIDHVGVVRPGELFCDRDRWFFTMERLRGMRLAPSACPTHEAVVQVAATLAETLDTLHRSGCVHCDVKPSNVMVEPCGRVVLLDFGIAVHATTTRWQAPTPAGTHVYMAPEVRSGAAPSPASDWYSLGVVLRELLDALQTYDGTAVAADLAAIVSALTDADPHQRTNPRTALADALQLRCSR